MEGSPDRDRIFPTLLQLQRDEITECSIYRKIAGKTKEAHNRDVLVMIADQEYEHYKIWKKYTGRDVGPDAVRIWYYYIMARLLGITFAIKLMEGIERRAQELYRQLGHIVPEVNEIVVREASHEKELIGLLDEERLRYMGSIVLGLNDALVEFTGSLAGFTFALQSTRIIAVAGLITGVAASLSMAASEYLSRRSNEDESRAASEPLKASAYTGIAYIITVALLVAPYLLLENPYVALILTLGAAVLVIFLFTFYISVAKDLPFSRRFTEMAIISLGIAAISFAIGILIRIFLGVSI